MLDPTAYRERDYFAVTRDRRRKETYNRALHQVLFNKLDQKLWLDRVMPAVAPPLTHYLAGHELVDLASGGRRELRTILSLLRERGELFLKPSGDGGGHGALRLEHGPETILVNGEKVDPQAWLSAFAKKSPSGYTISEIIHQGEWSKAFFPPTLNTLRVLTGTHFSDHRPVLLAATMKMGRPSTFPTDNWKVGRGGISARVDTETGQLEPGLDYDPATRSRRLSQHHPDSGATIAGSTIPNWAPIKAAMLTLASLLPFPGLVGWDVALTDANVVIVEANTSPGLDIHQCHGSLKRTPEQRAFWKEMRML